MTDINELLRTAAEDMPDNLYRAEQVVARGRRRRRRDRALFAGAAVIVAVGAVGLLQSTVFDRHAAVVPATVSPPTTSSPIPAATEERVAFGILTISMPAGWEVLERETTPAGTETGRELPAREWMCIGPANVEVVAFCPGLSFERGAVVGNELQLFTAHQPAGWYSGTGVAPCPVGDPEDGPGGLNGAHPGSADGSLTADPIETGLRPVGDRTADYDRWAGYCDNGFTFTPQSWYLPQSMIRILDYLSNPQTDAVLRSATFVP